MKPDTCYLITIMAAAIINFYPFLHTSTGHGPSLAERARLGAGGWGATKRRTDDIRMDGRMNRRVKSINLFASHRIYRIK